MVPLKYLSNFWRTLEMPLINCEISLILTWSTNCVIVSTNVANQNATFEISDTKLYVPVVTLSTQDNCKMLKQLKPGFKRIINWNKYLSKPELLRRNPNLNHFVEPSFQGVNRLFVLAFENDTQITSAKGCHLPNVEIKDYNIINGENIFDQPMNFLEGFLGRLLGPLLKTGLPLIKSVIQPLTKSALIPLELTAAADAGIHKKC